MHKWMLVHGGWGWGGGLEDRLGAGNRQSILTRWAGIRQEMSAMGLRVSAAAWNALSLDCGSRTGCEYLQEDSENCLHGQPYIISSHELMSWIDIHELMDVMKGAMTNDMTDQADQLMMMWPDKQNMTNTESTDQVTGYMHDVFHVAGTTFISIVGIKPLCNINYLG